MGNHRGDGRHPMQPLSPKRQPWMMANRALARSPRSPKEALCKSQTVEEELLLRERIEERAMVRLEKRHDALSLDRQARRLQRQKSAGNAGKIVKALQERELKRSSSVGCPGPAHVR